VIYCIKIVYNQQKNDNAKRYPQNVETKTESQDLIKYWNILKRRYQPQSGAGKKKKRQYKPLNK